MHTYARAYAIDGARTSRGASETIKSSRDSRREIFNLRTLMYQNGLATQLNVNDLLNYRFFYSSRERETTYII